MVFFNFFEFFAFFFEFSITGRVGTHWNDFFFLSYPAFPNLFSLFFGLPQHILPRKEAIIVFSIFLEFSITGRVGTPRNDFFVFFSLFLGHSQLILAWKVAKIVVFNFLNFFAIFWNFLLRVGKELFGTIFFFSLPRPSPTYFGLRRSDNGGF